MTTLSSLPPLIVPKRKVKVIVTITGTGANSARLWIVNAPPGSEHRANLDQSRQRRIKVFEAKSGGGVNDPWETSFDVGGPYTFVVQEYTRGASGHGGGYQFDPDAAPEETPVGDEETLTLHIGQRFTFPVGTGADTATLLTWVWNDKIRITTLEHHGEASPDIIEPTDSPKIRAALESTAVRTAVAALSSASGLSCDTALGNPSTIVSDMVTNHNGHTVLAVGIHNNGDGDNLIPPFYASTMAPKDLPTFVNLVLQYQRRHRLNDDGTGVPGAGDYHNPTGSLAKADFANVPIIDAVGSLAEAYAALAEIYRCHEGHRVIPSEWHGNPSGAFGTFALATLPPVLLVHLRVFEVLASFASTVPDTQTPGAMLMIERAGGLEG